MTTFFFVRHGETDWNRAGRLQGSQNIPLNDEGRAQAHRLAGLWSDGGDVLLSSPQARARETAEILGEALGLTLRGTDDRLVERCFGECEGLTVAERQVRYPDFNIPGMESAEAVQARARAFLDAQTLEHPGRRLVVVSHGGFINALLTLVTNGDIGTGKTLLGNASVTQVDYTASGWSVPVVGRSLERASLGLRE